MHVRLTETDLHLVDQIKAHFAGLDPLPAKLTTAEAVRIALRTTVKDKLARQRQVPLPWGIRDGAEAAC